MNKTEAKKIVRKCVRALKDHHIENLMEAAYYKRPVILDNRITNTWVKGNEC